MFLHFQDWTIPLLFKRLEKRGIPHGDKIIKVVATLEDPRILYRKRMLAIVNSDGLPFAEDEEFSYEGRGLYTGAMLEQELTVRGHSERSKEAIRALMRFANKPELGFCQRAMEARSSTGEWLIPHPFEDLHGADNPRIPATDIHLDIFYQDSLEALGRVINLDRLELMMGAMEYTHIRHEGRFCSREKER